MTPCLVTRNLVYDLQALRQGETTLADIAQQRGVEYVTGTLVTAMTVTGLNLVYQQGKLVIAPIAQNIQHSVAIQQSKRLACTALSKAGINLRPSTTPTGQVITQSTHINIGRKTPNLAQVPKVPSKVAGVSDKIAAGNPLSNAEHVAAKPPVASSSSTVQKQPSTVTGNLEKFSNNEAHSTVSGLNLNKSLASEAQLAALNKDGGRAIAGMGTKKILRDAPRLSAKHGGNPKDWSKVTSKSYKATDGTVFEIHAYRNAVTGKLVEAKTIPLELRK